MLRRNVLVLALGLVILSGGAWSDERQSAIDASQGIMTSLSEGRYRLLWDTQISQFFKDLMTEEAFVANMSMGRSQLGKLVGSKIIDVQYTEHDPASGYKGNIYSTTFLNAYEIGGFYERIVVLKESDGTYRLSGIWGSPAPSQ